MGWFERGNRWFERHAFPLDAGSAAAFAAVAALFYLMVAQFGG